MERALSLETHDIRQAFGSEAVAALVRLMEAGDQTPEMSAESWNATSKQFFGRPVTQQSAASWSSRLRGSDAVRSRRGPRLTRGSTILTAPRLRLLTPKSPR